MLNRYELIEYSDEDKKILDNTIFTNEDLILINNLKTKLKDKSFASAIEAFYKFHKNNYSTSDLAEIFKVSSRQIQRIFKDLGINRDRFEAQQIAVNKRDYVEIRKTYKKTMLGRLTDTQLSGSLLEQYIRHQADLLLGDTLPQCEIIVGINSMNVISSESDIPIIIINNNALYKYIIEVDGDISHKSEFGKKRDKNKNSKAYYKGYTLFRINTKAYFDSSEAPKIKYEKEVKDKLIKIVNLIASEVIENNSPFKLE